MTSSRHAVSNATTRTPSIADGPTHLPSLPSVHAPDTEEYTWDWGNFPQRTPIRTTFPLGHGYSSGTSVDLTSRKGKGRMMSEVPDATYALARAAAMGRCRIDEEEDPVSYGMGGRLTVDKNDSTRYRVFIEGRTVEFELAVISPDEEQEVDGREPHAGTLGFEDEVEDAKYFEQNKVDFHRFLLDDVVVNDPNLVLRWGDRYVALVSPDISIRLHITGICDGTTARPSWTLYIRGGSLLWRISVLCYLLVQRRRNRCRKTSQ